MATSTLARCGQSSIAALLVLLATDCGMTGFRTDRSMEGVASNNATLFVPVILSASGLLGSFYTSEMVVTNRGTTTASITYTYVASTGGGSGTATDALAPGQQKIVADAIEFLRSKSVPIPGSGSRVGTLRVAFTGLSSSSAAAVTVRTATLVPPATPTGRTWPSRTPVIRTCASG